MTFHKFPESQIPDFELGSEFVNHSYIDNPRVEFLPQKNVRSGGQLEKLLADSPQNSYIILGVMG